MYVSEFNTKKTFELSAVNETVWYQSIIDTETIHSLKYKYHWMVMVVGESKGALRVIECGSKQTQFSFNPQYCKKLLMFTLYVEWNLFVACRLRPELMTTMCDLQPLPNWWFLWCKTIIIINIKP